MSGNNVQTSSTSSTTSSTVRPRVPRLISILDDGEESDIQLPTAHPNNSNNNVSNNLISADGTPFGSRSASPIPAPHPQRSTSSTPGASTKFANSSWGRRAQLAAQKYVPSTSSPSTAESPSTLAGVWGQSWSTLQGLASEFLGNEDGTTSSTSVKDNSAGASARRKKKATSSVSAFGTWLSAAPPSSHPRTASPRGGRQPNEWGARSASPAASSAIGAGTREERESALRAQKRLDMLLSQESSYADALGKFKRRLSDGAESSPSSSVPPLGTRGKEHEDQGGEALVYVHVVEKEDTVAGIAIKYSCSAGVLRKANRMWANDTPQTRRRLVIPVAACGVKGKPVAGPDEGGTEVDLLSPEADSFRVEEMPPPPTTTTMTTATGGDRKAATLANGDPARTRESSVSAASSDHHHSNHATSNSTAKEPWVHDSWVLLPSFSQPTEIARLSRRTLGYFPPARRKSSSFSSEAGGRGSAGTSIDIPRSTTTTTTTNTTTTNPVATAPSLPTTAPSSASATPTGSLSPTRATTGKNHKRRPSNASTGYFPSYLSGPGGVGTMNANVRCPGPAQDGLNKIFAKHLPDVGPPKHSSTTGFGAVAGVDMYTDDEDMTSGGFPAEGRGGGMGLENVGGAIEGWVRRMAKKAKDATAPPAQTRAARASVGAPGKGAGGVGDLIEMVDEFEVGVESSEDEEERERGRQGSAAGAGYLAGAGGGGSGVGRRGTVRRAGSGKGEAGWSSASGSASGGWKGGKGD